MTKDNRPYYRFRICLVDGTVEKIVCNFATRAKAMQEMQMWCREGAFIPYDKPAGQPIVFDEEHWAYIPAHRITKVTMRRVI